jgi:hypothetical protein
MVVGGFRRAVMSLLRNVLGGMLALSLESVSVTMSDPTCGISNMSRWKWLTIRFCDLAAIMK